MKATVDLHVHSEFSCDSSASIDEMCLSAIEKGLLKICFTEHYDLNPKDNGCNYFNSTKYSEEIKRAQNKYSNKLHILKGIEFSEPHVYPEEFEAILKQEYDFILGSVHWFGDYWIADRVYQSMYTIEQLFEMYYCEVIKMVDFGGFDAIAHIDFPKRYLLRTHEPEKILEDIIKEIVRKNIVLELNSSPIRKGRAEPYPSKNIARLYVKHGGKKVTLGSDAHSRDEIGQDFDLLFDIVAEQGFQVVSFVKRKEDKI